MPVDSFVFDHKAYRQNKGRASLQVLYFLPNSTYIDLYVDLELTGTSRSHLEVGTTSGGPNVENVDYMEDDDVGGPNVEDGDHMEDNHAEDDEDYTLISDQSDENQSISEGSRESDEEVEDKFATKDRHIYRSQAWNIEQKREYYVKESDGSTWAWEGRRKAIGLVYGDWVFNFDILPRIFELLWRILTMDRERLRIMVMILNMETVLHIKKIRTLGTIRLLILTMVVIIKGIHLMLGNLLKLNKNEKISEDNSLVQSPQPPSQSELECEELEETEEIISLDITSSPDSSGIYIVVKLDSLILRVGDKDVDQVDFDENNIPIVSKEGFEVDTCGEVFPSIRDFEDDAKNGSMKDQEKDKWYKIEFEKQDVALLEYKFIFSHGKENHYKRFIVAAEHGLFWYRDGYSD
ncbi:OLC1v1004957C1 [Oldenlandia corymbosa var. corymbosa]|uniref:OLC1v1004957C1 n=1 Tax=Oldenlandia corymbosa var. corymbosa TaxID=529605 RepID=A0AAV1DFW8_OLDCO|nr:OLC1v1004957C1 [Oldenlandia corymbosa var. corymbosa]